MRTVLVPRERFERWVANFAERHGGGPGIVTEAGGIFGLAQDGSTFHARLPFDVPYDGPADATEFAAAISPPLDWGLLLVRKGGFAVARLAGEQLVDSKVGQRHVQGRTKAGGQSQQRFARRRDNQARQAYEAAADHAARLLGQGAPHVVTGGDHAAVDEVLTDPRLKRVIVDERWLPVADPKRGVLEQAILDAGSAWVQVANSGEDTPQ